jgi:ATP-dependent DNA ligase
MLLTSAPLRRRGQWEEPPRHGRAAVTLYAFDVLRHQGRGRDEPWTVRRAVLDRTDLAMATLVVVRTVSYTDDGKPMHQATLEVGAEGTVSKKGSSIDLPGQRVRWWTKTKHRRTSNFQIVGWRPSTPFPPGDLIVAENGEPIGTAFCRCQKPSGPG